MRDDYKIGKKDEVRSRTGHEGPEGGGIGKALLFF